jgi:UPF0716 protein FxsA
MRAARIAIVLLVAWPILEIVSIVAAADLVGGLPTILILIGGGLGGALLVRLAGMAALREIGVQLRARAVEPGRLIGPTRLALAGVLLAVPGFVSDVVALALAVPGIERLLPRPTLRARVVRSGAPPVIEVEARRVDGPPPHA